MKLQDSLIYSSRTGGNRRMVTPGSHRAVPSGGMRNPENSQGIQNSYTSHCREWTTEWTTVDSTLNWPQHEWGLLRLQYNIYKYRTVLGNVPLKPILPTPITQTRCLITALSRRRSRSSRPRWPGPKRTKVRDDEGNMNFEHPSRGA